jgi:hypothetical protein
MLDLKLPYKKGQNHLGYWGFVDRDNHLVDDGAMNIVVTDWRKDIPKIKKKFKVRKPKELGPGPVERIKRLRYGL